MRLEYEWLQPTERMIEFPGKDLSISSLSCVGERLCTPCPHHGLAAIGLEIVDVLRVSRNAATVLQVQQYSVFDDIHDPRV